MAAKIGETLSLAMVLDTGRFLDAPEFQVFHDHGNEQNVFDRFDYVLSPRGRSSPELPIYPLLVSDSELVRPGVP